jgi:hypothetical protein
VRTSIPGAVDPHVVDLLEVDLAIAAEAEEVDLRAFVGEALCELEDRGH